MEVDNGMHSKAIHRLKEVVVQLSTIIDELGEEIQLKENKQEVVDGLPSIVRST